MTAASATQDAAHLSESGLSVDQVAEAEADRYGVDGFVGQLQPVDVAQPEVDGGLRLTSALEHGRGAITVAAKWPDIVPRLLPVAPTRKTSG